MSIIEKFDKLASMSEIKHEDKIKVYDILLSFSEYIALVVRKNIKSPIYLLEDRKMEDKINEKYEKCIEGIAFINSLSVGILGERIYDKEFMRNEVERFIHEVIDEIYRNRVISRR